MLQNMGDPQNLPRLNKLNSKPPPANNIQTGSLILKTETGPGIGKNPTRPKIKPALPTRISLRKINKNDKEVLKKLEATPIYSKISREKMIKRLRAFEAIDSGRLSTRHEVCQQFGVTGVQVNVWVHKREMIEKEAMDDKNLMELRSINNFPVEMELTKYCIQCLEQKSDITKENLLREACNIAERMGMETFVASPLWLSCFLMRNALKDVPGKNMFYCDIEKMLSKRLGAHLIN
jgi:Tc5 transposase DNA-binding domain